MPARHRILSALVLVAALAAVAATAPAPLAAAAPAARTDAEMRPVDINTAASSELEAVPGIGKSLASRIIAFRDKNGAYKSVDDLLKVQGIGEKSLEKLRPYLTVAKAK